MVNIAIKMRLDTLRSEEMSLSKVEVYLNENQVNNLKSILQQSEQGIHVLFENALIAEVFRKPYSEDEFFEVGNLKKIQDDILKLLQIKTLQDKKDFINSLDKEAQHRVVRAYFYMIENNLRSNQKRPHWNFTFFDNFLDSIQNIDLNRRFLPNFRHPILKFDSENSITEIDSDILVQSLEKNHLSTRTYLWKT